MKPDVDPEARWNVMLAELVGDALPPLPAIAGRVHQAEDKDLEHEPTLGDELRAAAGWIRPGMRGPKA